ncbi:ASCH domain-containing protein [Erwinia psidii]|uniref:ASCH domain-containing protein n=1 Tax=Erwinia psidii TaxID=69224 RepID=UPI00226B9D75|nr:ASCH domain-containing protein [Erwinia psidii]MCX8960771.1 ASCH domain-containing protein [Erwinia psidii]
MDQTATLEKKYPGAIAWSFGDSHKLADELADLVISGIKTASCSSFCCFEKEENPPAIGGYSIILNGDAHPVCVIRTLSLRVMRFNGVTEEHARKEGEGDLSLNHWRQAHQAFFRREGTWSDSMEVVAEEFELIEIVSPSLPSPRRTVR